MYYTMSCNYSERPHAHNSCSLQWCIKMAMGGEGLLDQQTYLLGVSSDCGGTPTTKHEPVLKEKIVSINIAT